VLAVPEIVIVATEVGLVVELTVGVKVGVPEGPLGLLGPLLLPQDPCRRTADNNKARM
jgi:hypothetical protein